MRKERTERHPRTPYFTHSPMIQITGRLFHCWESGGDGWVIHKQDIRDHGYYIKPEGSEEKKKKKTEEK